jgi:hypothetical protein
MGANDKTVLALPKRRPKRPWWKRAFDGLLPEPNIQKKINRLYKKREPMVRELFLSAGKALREGDRELAWRELEFATQLTDDVWDLLEDKGELPWT